MRWLRAHRLLRWVLAFTMFALAGVAFLSWPHVQRFTTGLPPDQFHRELDPALVEDYPAVLGVAHNAGNSLSTTTLALEHGADVIEIDVISVRGQVVAGRDAPWPWIGDHLFRGPSLAQVWDHAASAKVIKLDLKQTNRPFLDQIVDFLAPRAGERAVMVSTRDIDAIEYLHAKLPEVTMLFSVAWPDARDRVQADPKLVAAIGGMTVFQGLVSEQFVTWAHDHHLLVLAWTVNDVERLNELVRLRVDGVTTANLAILQALS